MPDFIGIGSGKCGTTWIYEMLVQHPSVNGGHAKELNFFCSNMPYYSRGIKWYEDNFNPEPQKITGEYSVTYFYDCAALERISKHYPNAKTILSLRDPVERAHSDFLHDIRKGRIKDRTTFNRFLDEHYDHRYSLYADQLKISRDIFGDNLIIIPYSYIAEKPGVVLRRLYEFLGIDENYLPPDYDKPVNKGFTPIITAIETSMTRTSAWLTKKGYVRFLQAVKNTKIQEAIRRLNSAEKPELNISQDRKRKLEALYSREIEALEQIELEWKQYESDQAS